MSHRIGPALAILMSLSLAFAADEPPQFAEDGRSAELWETYQWGRTDESATAVPWEKMIGPEQQPPAFDPEVVVREGVPSIRMTERDGVYQFERPVPIPGPIEGKLLRLYLWMRGEDVASEVSTWGAPRFKVVFRDSAGAIVNTKQRITWTVGTYPWHCYHGEFRVPRESATMHLVLVGDRIGDGTAWFSDFSWEFIDSLTGTFDGNEIQDPVTGSVALNPRHDFLSWHVSSLRTHRATRYPFRFLEGGLPGQPLDVTTLEGLERYFRDFALYRSDGMHRGLPALAWFYQRYHETGLIPELEEGWLETLYAMVGEVQDERTGYWYYLDSRGPGAEKELSLGLTFHIAGSVYAFRGREVPRPERIVRTTLAMQSSHVTEEGERHPAAWGADAYNFTRNPDADPVKCRLVTTWDAVSLVRYAWPQLPEDMRERAWNAVKHAVRYAIDHNMLPNGLFLQQDTDAHLTSDNYVFNILADSRFLERHVNPEIPRPEVTVWRGDGRVSLSVVSEHPDVVSFRVYAPPADQGMDDLQHDQIVAIAQRDGVILTSKDPLLLAERIIEAYARRWDRPFDQMDTGRVKPVFARVAMLPDDLEVSKRGEPVVLPEKVVGGGMVVVTAVSRFNEESLPAIVEMP